MRDFRTIMVKVHCVFKMKDPMSTCSFNLLYQNVKRFSKNGECFFKELLVVFQQRAELEHTYAKGLQKLAGKLIKASKGMTNNSTYNAWSNLSDEMCSAADTHRTLANAFQQEAILELRQVLEEHNRRKRPLDSVIERTGKLVAANWNEQLKMKKKLVGLTREHESLFNFVEKNKHICTEKEKQKMFNRLTKSAEAQARVDEEYFNINIESYQIRLKWENTLKSCYHVLQELEKQRIEIMCNILHRYILHMSSFGQTLLHGQRRLDHAVQQQVDLDKDIRDLTEEITRIEENKAEFLMVDYFEEDNKSLMEKGRRKDGIKVKLKRLEESITNTKKNCEGLEKLLRTYSENPSFSNQKNLEETEEMFDESTLKLDLLEATHCKLSTSLSEIEGKPKILHRFSDSITRWKDKDCEHSVVELTRPVKIRKTPARSCHALRASVYKGSVHHVSKVNVKHSPEPLGQNTSTAASNKDTTAVQCGGSVNGGETKNDNGQGQTDQWCSIGRCKALYDFTSEKDDELNFKEGDLLDIYLKDQSGWWIGVLNGETGQFPSTYVEELPTFSVVQSSHA